VLSNEVCNLIFYTENPRLPEDRCLEMEGYVSNPIYVGQRHFFIKSSVSYFRELATLTVTRKREASQGGVPSACLHNVTWHASPDAVRNRF
jgi:hypothetical protein